MHKASRKIVKRSGYNRKGSKHLIQVITVREFHSSPGLRLPRSSLYPVAIVLKLAVSAQSVRKSSDSAKASKAEQRIYDRDGF